MKFIHAADIHLDSPLHGLARYEGAPHQRLRGATRQALENLVQLCLDEEVDLLLIAGDLFDGEWKDFNTGLFFIRQMARLREANIPVHLVLGNHDAQSTLRRQLRWPDNVHCHSTRKPDSKQHPELGVVVHGQSYAQRETTDDLAAGYPEAIPGLLNIGLLHTNLNDSGSHANYAPTLPETLISKGYSYWALGHVHQQKLLHTQPHIAFSGNLQGRHARETGAKGCLLVECGELGVESVEFRPVDVLRWEQLELDLSVVESRAQLDNLLLRQLAERVEAADGRLLALRLTLHGTSPLHGWLNEAGERLREELIGLCVDHFDEQLWLERLILDTRPPYDRKALRNNDDPIASLLGQIDQLHTDPSPLQVLADDLAGLAAALPPALREGESAIRADDPAWLAAQLEAVEHELLARLQRGHEDDHAH